MSILRVLGRLLVRAVALEVGIWRSLYLWIARRRPGTGPGIEAFGYAALVRPVIWGFIGVSAVEVAAVHLVVARWPVVQTAFLVVGIWGLLWMLGLLAAVTVFPHLVTPEGLRVRYGTTLDVLVPWQDVEAIAPRSRDVERNRRILVEDGPDGEVLKVVQLKQTNVDVRLVRPLVVRLPQGECEVVEVHLHADEPRQLVAAARRAQTAYAAT